ncbi:fatty acid synthase alpha subunit Lsd1 [Basidiobolus ranarum]|uniref:Fatty acid synthase alpha subunit Lsd1 n=1 Tax=Basidiobolus ranarum TaxID=34480 RepID=A0ABR2WVZ6_9FUNG
MVVAKISENTSRLIVLQRVIPESADTFTVSINVSDSFYATAERLVHNFESVPLDTKSFESPDSVQKTIWIYLTFIKYVLYAAEPDSRIFAAKLFVDFCTRFLQQNEIHFVTRTFGREIRKSILKTFFELFNYLEVNSCLDPTTPLPECPAIFNQEKSDPTIPFAIFGGQGNTGSFKELQEIWECYRDLVFSFIFEISESLNELSKNISVNRFYPHGFNIISWLERPETYKPDSAFLETAPVSFPMIGLVQLAHYYILFRAFRKTPGWLREQFKSGVTGHSQGIVAAIAIASSETEDDFINNSRKAISLLFWIGARSQQTYPVTPIPANILQECASENLDVPTCMLSINGLTLAKVEKHVSAFNSCLNEMDQEKRITISLVNGVKLIACTGAPESLWNLNVSLSKIKANPENIETKIPFSKRLKNFNTRFMPVTIPAHNELLRPATITIAKDAELSEISFKREDITIPVFSIDTGANMQQSDEITKYLIDQVCVNRVHWQKAINVNDITHIIDFGPGGVSGAGMLTHKNKEGRGVLVLLAGMLVSTNPDLKCKAAVFNTSIDHVRFGVDWAKEFGPKLVRTSNGDIKLDTKYSRLTGKPPLLVGGMTPTTANAQFVSAVTNAGYNIEVGCGALYSPEVLQDCITSIQGSISAGEGIVCNMVFINQFLWSFQFPGILNMRKRQGIRISGVCVAAGVPTTEYANKMCAELQESGIEHVSFKPDSEQSIRQVCHIAAQNPTMPIILQWTGGRSGGHHSYEDVHAPIIETYSYIRSQPNVVLVIGSGFGDAEGTLPYITGDWSMKFGYAPMPFDGILFGTRMCVAKEAKTSNKIKDLIVQTPGIEHDEDWEKTYQGPVGGIVTVESEYGEPIHNIATRGILFWKELDETIFSITNLDKRLEVIRAKREYIIRRLNEDSQKVWFGKKQDGRNNVDLEEMTYSEILYRFVELVFVAKRKQWLDASHRNTVGDLITRIEERFTKSTQPQETFLKSYDDLNVENPFMLIAEFLEKYPDSKSQLITSEDIQYFIGLCRRKDKKPPPFVAVLDKELHVWFKRDSLWQAEDIDAVPGEDPDRVVVLQGPVAVRYSKIANQPVKEILDEIAVAHVKSIQERYYSNTEIPYQEYMGGAPIKHIPIPNGVKTTVSNAGRTVTYELGSHNESLPNAGEWIEFLAGKSYSWFRALLTSPSIVRGNQIDSNTFPRVFRPRTDQRFVVRYDEKKNIDSVDIYGWARCNDKPSLEVSFDTKSKVISILLREGGNYGIEELLLKFQYKPERGCAPIQEILETRNESIKNFFYTLWFGNNELVDNTLNSVYKSTRVINQEHLEFFANVVRYSSRNTKMGIAFTDFAIVTSWESVFKTIFAQEFDTDITRLVHMRNGFEILDAKNPMKVGDTIYTESTISAVVNLESGKMIEVSGHVYREGKEIMRVKSQFLCRGKFDDYHMTFRKRDEPVTRITMESENDAVALASRSWLKCYEGCTIQAKRTYVFRLRTEEYFSDRHSFAKVTTIGELFEVNKKEIAIGEISFEASGVSIEGNSVLQYLSRASNIQVEGSTVLFESGGYNIVPAGTKLLQHAPPTNEGYSQASEDVNPIHTNVYFADLAELPGPITHGMWTSAATRRFVETFAANNVHSRIRGYEVQFVGMVLPGDALETKLTHIGMKDGLMVIKVQTFSLRTQEVVLEGEALVEQPLTAYVFTGQGSQEVGMGMDLYASSPVAKNIWDTADQYLQDNYGVSILEIVRRNPKEITVYFGNEWGAMRPPLPRH